jgi:hypothetical protein
MASRSRPLGVTSGFPTNYGGFLGRPSLPAGYLPTGIVSGDFNEDGKPDFAISNGGDNSVYVYIGNGDGTFQTPEVLFTQGQSPVSIATASLRKNGHLDLILADADSKQVETFLGNGDGTFSKGTTVSVPQIPTFVTTADFDKNGTLDIVVGLTEYLYLQPLFEVLQGDGKGGFPFGIAGPGYQPPAGLNWYDPVPPNSIAVGDLNNDGYPDLVVSLGVIYTGISYLNSGQDSFSTADTFYPVDGLVTAALADMDGDGCLDAVQATGDGFITIAKGTCNGSFQEQDPAGVVGEVDDSIQVIDVDGDHNPDVVGTSSGSYGGDGGYHVTVMKGDGKGGLSNAITYVVQPGNVGLVAADFRSTGRPDLVSVSVGPRSNGTATVVFNDGTGAYGNPQGKAMEIYPPPGSQLIYNSLNAGLVPVDLNGDGRTDLLFTEADGNFYLTSVLSDGSGKFSAPVRTQLSMQLISPLIYTGDFHGTGKPDALVFQNPFVGSLWYFPGNGDGSFGAPVSLPTVGTTVAVGDLNNDGKLDFAAIGTKLDIFLGNGDGTFNHPTASVTMPSATTTPAQLFVGDFNHDGKPDLLAAYNGNGDAVASGDDLYLFAGNGDGTFQSPTKLLSHFGPLAVADLNHDGYLDLIQARDPNNNIGSAQVNSAAETIPAAVTVYLGQPGGTYKATTYQLPGTLDDSKYALPASVGDFNGDGIPDIAFKFDREYYDTYSPSTAILQGLGDGSFLLLSDSKHTNTLDHPLTLAKFLGGPATDMMVYSTLPPSIDIIPAAPGSSLSIIFSSSPMVTTSGTAVVTLTLPAASSTAVSLNSSDPAITMPASLNFSSGQQQSFKFTLNQGYDPSHLLALSATDPSGYTDIAFVQKPNSSTVATVTSTVDDSNALLTGGKLTTVPGQSSTFDLHLMSKDGYQGTFGSFVCTGLPSGASCSFAGSSAYVAPDSQGDINFTISTSPNTPQGNYTVTIQSTDGSLVSSVPLSVVIGDFSFTVNPTTLVYGNGAAPTVTITPSMINGLLETITFTCSGLPMEITGCQNLSYFPYTATPIIPTATLTPSASSLPAADYPFQIVGTIGPVSHTANAVYRVTGISGGISPSTASLTASGQSTNFTLTVNSVNHYANTVSITCSGPVGVTCKAITSPSTLTLSDGQTLTSTLTLTAIYSYPLSRNTKSFGKESLAAFVLCPLLLWVGTGRRRNHILTRGLALVCVGLLLTSITACSSGSGSSTAGRGGGGGGTSPTSFQITVYGYTLGVASPSTALGTVNFTIP